MRYFEIFFKKIKNGLTIIRDYGFYEFLIILNYRFINKNIRELFFRLLSIFFSKKIKNFKPLNNDNFINFCFQVGFGLIRPTQIRWEIKRLVELLYKCKVSKILEIGTENGGTLFIWSRLLESNGILISLDLPLKDGGYGYKNWRIKLFEKFIDNNKKLFLLKENSHKQETLEKVKQILSGNQLDFLFIDGDHSYEGVKKDFEMYSSLVRKGGIIAFHDIVLHSRGGSQAYKYWHEIKDKFKYEEFILDTNQNCCGIGIIYYN